MLMHYYLAARIIIIIDWYVSYQLDQDVRITASFVAMHLQSEGGSRLMISLFCLLGEGISIVASLL